ncbi:MAG: 30S ribosomal protein S6 [Rickettsiales bacterium]
MDNIVNNNNRFYDLSYLIKQDISSVDLEKINNDIISLIVSYGGKIVKQEYWGLRPLAYKINGNSKAHYMFFNLDIPNNECIIELEQKIKYSNEIIRKHFESIEAVSQAPSPMLKSFVTTENANTVDVTIANQKNIPSASAPAASAASPVTSAINLEVNS